MAFPLNYIVIESVNEPIDVSLCYIDLIPGAVPYTSQSILTDPASNCVLVKPVYSSNVSYR